VRPRSSSRARTGLLNCRGGRGRCGVLLEAVDEEEGADEDEGTDEDGGTSDWDVGVEGRRSGERNGALTGVRRRRRFGSRSSMKY
jgi:hypothetical protein